MFCWSYTEHCWRCCQTPFFQPLKHVAPQWKRKLPFGSSSTDTLLRKHWKLCVQKKKKKTICSFVSSARADLVSIRICISSFAFAPCAALQQSQHWFFTCGPFFLLLTTILLSLSLSRFLDTIAAASMEALLVNSATAAKASSACVASPTVSRQLSVTARFDGLKAFPMLKQRPTSFAPVASRHHHPLRISAVANADTLEVVSTLIAEQLAIDVSQVQAESKFTDLGADSLDTVEIMMALEEKFDIQLGEDNAEQIVTVQHAADLIQEVVAAKEA